MYPRKRTRAKIALLENRPARPSSRSIDIPIGCPLNIWLAHALPLSSGIGLGTIKTDSTLLSFRTRTVACGVIGLEYDPVCPFRCPFRSAHSCPDASARSALCCTAEARGAARSGSPILGKPSRAEVARICAARASAAAPSLRIARDYFPRRDTLAHNRFSRAYYYDVAIAATLTHACRACSRDFYAKRAVPLSRYSRDTQAAGALRFRFVSPAGGQSRAIPHDKVRGTND